MSTNHAAFLRGVADCLDDGLPPPIAIRGLYDFGDDDRELQVYSADDFDAWARDTRRHDRTVETAGDRHHKVECFVGGDRALGFLLVGPVK